MNKVLFILLAVLQCSAADAQSVPLQNSHYFDRIGTEQGLSFGAVNCLLQDSRGFLWVGTENGLNRYDGNSFFIYRHDHENSNSIINNNIRSLAEDANGNIWIGTDKGVSKLNPYRNRFINYQHIDRDSTSLSDDYINHVFVDHEKNIWTGNPGGLNLFDTLTHRFHAFTFQNPAGKYLIVNSFCEQDQNHLWIGTNDGLFLFDKRTKKHEYFKAPGMNPFLVNCLQRDTLGNLWIGTWAGGAFRFDPVKKIFTQYEFNFTNEYTSATNIVLALAQTVKNEDDFTMWFGTTEGLLRMNIRNNVYPVSFSGLPFYKNEAVNPHSISSNNVSDLWYDRTGILWIATSNGVNKMIASRQAFQSVKISGNPTKTLVEKNKQWVTSWYGTGLTLFDSSWKEIEHFTRVPPLSANLDNSQVSTACRDENGLLWIATFHGLVSYDETKKKFTEFHHDENDGRSLSENRITYVFHDSKNRLWVGTYNRGINLKLPGHPDFVHFLHDEKNPVSLCDNKIWMITEDKQHHIWIGTNYGLARYEETSNTFTNYFSDSKNGATISSFYEDVSGRSWVSTKEGVYTWNSLGNNFIPVKYPKELTQCTIYSILGNDDGNLWLASQKGLIRYNPTDSSILIFDKQDGLPFDDLSGSFDMDSLHHLYIGGYGQLITFNVHDVIHEIPKPDVYITSMKIFEHELPVDSVMKLKKPLQLSHDQNMITFQFTAPGYIHTERIQFAYRLEGLEKAWNMAGTNRTATYSSLPPGNYLFHVKATAINGEWSDQEATMNMVIAPPFWKTWWFRTLMAIAFISVILFIIRLRDVRIKKRAEEKTLFNTQLAEVEMKALRAQMNPHFIFNALNSIQECVVTNQNDAAYNYLSKFSKLVRLILENSEQSLVPVKKEIDALKLYLDLESLRFQNFSYTISIDKSIDQETEKIPSMLIQPFAENSIKHGLATKPGNRFLKIELHKDANRLSCIVEDNGIGREKSKELKSAFKKDHESKGMKITEDRIKLIAAKNNLEVQLKIVDLYDAGKLATGTRVEIEIPCEN